MLTRPPAASPAVHPPDANAQRSPRRQARGFLHALVGAALLLPLIVYASVGAFTRYAADDYCTAGILRTEGLLGAQKWWYLGFSPRYAFSFAVSTVELLGPAVVPILPTIAMLVWLLVSTWTISRFGAVCPRLKSMAIAALLAELVTFAVLSTTPDIAQSLYWQTGMLTYLLPLVLLTLYVGWVQTRVTRTLRGAGDPPVSLLLSAAIPLIAGGMSETYLAFQGIVLFLALVGCLVFRTPATRAALPHVAVGWAASAVALGIIQVSPTVSLRESGLKPPVSLAVGAAINTGWLFVVRFLRHSMFVALLCVALPAGIAPATGRTADHLGTIARHLGAIALATFVAIVACFFPAFFAQGGDPPARSQIVPDFALVCFLIYVGLRLQPWLLRLAVRAPRPAVAAAVGALALTPVVVAAGTLPERAAAAQYAARWDTVDQELRAAQAAGATRVFAPQLPRALGQSFVMSTDANYWFNQCVARYYGLQSVTADLATD